MYLRLLKFLFLIRNLSSSVSCRTRGCETPAASHNTPFVPSNTWYPPTIAKAPEATCTELTADADPKKRSGVCIFSSPPTRAIRLVASPSLPSEIVNTGHTASVSKIWFASVMRSSTHDTRISNWNPSWVRVYRYRTSPHSKQIITCYESRIRKCTNRSRAGYTERGPL